MSEVRLVRCPKCDKVLPEPAGYPVYQCGGCGTVLRAKKKSSGSDGLLDGPGDEKLVNSGSSNIDKESLVEEGIVSMDSRSQLRSRIGNLDVHKSPLREGGLNEFHGPKSPMRDRFLDDLGKTPMVSRDVSRSPIRERDGSYDVDHDGSNSPARSSNVSKSPMRGRSRAPVSVRTRDVSKSPMREGTSLGELGDVGRSTPRSMNGDVSKSPLRQCIGSDFEGNTEQETVRKMAPKASFGAWLPDDKHEGMLGDNYPAVQNSTWRDRAVDRPDQISKGVKSVSSDEPGLTSEGSFDDPFHGMGRSKGGTSRDGRSRSAFVGGNAGPNVVDGPPKYHPDSIYGYGDPRHSFESARGPASVQESQLQRAELLRKYKEIKDQLSGLDEAEVSSPGFYSEPDGFSTDESSGLRRGPMQPFPPEGNVQRPSHFSHGPGLAHNREDVYNFNRPMYKDQFAGEMQRGLRSNQHLPKHRVPGHVPGQSLDGYQDSRYSYVNNNTHTHHPACDCSLCYYSNDWQGQDGRSSSAHRRHASLAANSNSSQSMDLERYGSCVYDPKMTNIGPHGRSSHPVHNHRRLALASLNKRLCRPISGGAPFVICDSCFQLLILPGNFIAKHKNKQLKCGACTTVISFDLQHKSIEPLSPQKKPESVHAGGSSSEVPNVSHPKHHRGSLAATSTNIGSYDFDAGGYNLHSMGSEASKATKGPPHFSVDGRISDTASVRSSQPNSSEMPVKAVMTRPPPGSPLDQHLDYSSHFHLSQAADKQVVDKETSPEGLLNITDATETEVHFDDLPRTGLSHDSGDIPTESPVPVNDKVAGSRIDAILDGWKLKSGHAQVYVNGQAISHRSVKKAEKLAGPIQPGEYWYDPKAGFWGVKGYRCLGIIPPFIREFSFPMPEDGSRGDSAVYVNGRELPKKDLDLLAKRGLPTTRDKHYVVDISGKVLDEQTRDFIVNLGRLAPSVEKNKCGFGMQVPEQLDD